MVCNRCIMVIESELQKLNLNPVEVALGEATFERELTVDEKLTISRAIEPLGFSLIDDRRSQLIAKIKAAIVALVHQQGNQLDINLSDYLSDLLHHDYKYLTHLFTEVEGTTIEKYFIAQKIEKVKELLVYDEFTLSEIAFQLNYSSAAHLSGQFKKVTGLTPSYFKSIREQKRKPLDEV